MKNTLLVLPAYFGGVAIALLPNPWAFLAGTASIVVSSILVSRELVKEKL